MPFSEWRQFQFPISLSQKSSSSWLKHFVAHVCGCSHLAVLLGSGSGDWVKQSFYLDQSPECVGNSDAQVYPFYLVMCRIGVNIFWERHGGSRCLSPPSCCVTTRFSVGWKAICSLLLSSMYLVWWRWHLQNDSLIVSCKDTETELWVVELLLLWFSIFCIRFLLQRKPGEILIFWQSYKCVSDSD